MCVYVLVCLFFLSLQSSQWVFPFWYIRNCTFCFWQTEVPAYLHCWFCHHTQLLSLMMHYEQQQQQQRTPSELETYHFSRSNVKTITTGTMSIPNATSTDRQTSRPTDFSDVRESQQGIDSKSKTKKKHTKKENCGMPTHCILHVKLMLISISVSINHIPFRQSIDNMVYFFCRFKSCPVLLTSLSPTLSLSHSSVHNANCVISILMFKHRYFFRFAPAPFRFTILEKGLWKKTNLFYLCVCVWKE